MKSTVISLKYGVFLLAGMLFESNVTCVITSIEDDAIAISINQVLSFLTHDPFVIFNVIFYRG